MRLRSFFKILIRTVAVIILLLILVYGLLQIPTVQTWVVGKVAITLSDRLGAKVSVKRVNFHFFNEISLQGLMVEDKQKDTLLYAGQVDATINNWFIFKDEYDLKNIKLTNSIINMQRQDSVWNYQFLVNYFSKPKTGKQKKKINLNLRELHFEQVQFNKIDGWVGQNLVASMPRMDLITDSVNFNTSHIAINSLSLVKPVFWQRDYVGKRPPPNDLTPVLNKIPVVSAFKWNNSGFYLSVKKMDVQDGTFMNEKYTDRPAYTDRFDGKHIRFEKINGSINQLRFFNDTLSAQASLSANEKNGLQIKKLSALLKFTPEFMEFKDLSLQSNRSTLGDYLSFSYKTFGKDFSNFIESVVMNVRLKPGSILHSDDLALFGPGLKTWKRIFYLQGTANGTISNFNAYNLKIKTGNSYFDGNLAMRGLPNIKTTFIDVKANSFKTNTAELSKMIPAIKNGRSPDLYALGNINYAGTYRGYIDDFAAKGNLGTSLGNISADISIKMPAGAEPVYSGYIDTRGFNLGRFLKNGKLGMVAAKGTVKGRSFTPGKMKLSFDVAARSFYYDGYTYQNVEIDGGYENNRFYGLASINDPNIQIKNINGSFIFTGNNPTFMLKAQAQKLDLQKIGLSKKPLSITGDFDLNFKGNNIDNFLGTAYINNATLLSGNRKISFDALSLTSVIEDGIKRLSLASTELDADVLGNFKIMDIPAAFQTFLSRYYPSYINPTNKKISQQDFTFSIRTKIIDDYLPLFTNQITGFNNATIYGGLQSDNNALLFNADVPYFAFDGKKFNNLSLRATGDGDTLRATTMLDDIILSDSFHLPETKISIAAHNDVSLVSIITSGSKTLNGAELNATVQSFSDGVKINFAPSEFVINDKRWTLERDGELTIRKDFIDASEVTFRQGNQKLVIATELDEINDNIHFVAKMENIAIKDFTPFFIKKPALGGYLTGTATLYNPFGKKSVEFKGVADSFAVDTNKVGKVNLAALANLETGEVKFTASALEDNYDFNLAGDINYKDSTGGGVDVAINAKRLQLEILQPYLKAIFSKMSGLATGDIKIQKANGKQTITGDANIVSGKFTVAYTNCTYLVNNQVLAFNKTNLNFGTIALKDELGNNATVEGVMYHDFFQNISFSGMRFETDKLLLLNTTKANNPQYYGRVIGRAVMTLTGPTSDLRMNIDGAPSPTDSSQVSLPTGESKESNVVDYIEFIKFGSEMASTIKASEGTNFTLNMNLEANPACQIDVILDEETKDIIRGRGNGRLNLTVGTKEPLRMSGRFDITDGEYTFNFQTFIRRPFIINNGSITWNGDPYQAQINIKADYVAKNVDLSSLNSLLSSTTGSNIGQKSDIIIVSTLQGVLTEPDISFEFLLPNNSELRRDYVIVKQLEEFKNDENLMLNQVASLLLFNSFIGSDQSFISQQNTLALATNTIGGLISGWLTSVLNKELSRATNGVVSTYLDINPSLNLNSTIGQLQANIRGGLRIALTEKLYFSAGGNFDSNNQLILATGRNSLTPDFTLEWLLNKDGSVRVIGYNRTSVDITNGQRNRTGVQLSYRRDVNKLGDLFRSKKKLLEEERQQNEAATKQILEDTLR